MTTPAGPARSASTERVRRAEDTAAAEMKKLLEKLNGIVEGLVTENAVLTARLDTVESGARTKATSDAALIRSLERVNSTQQAEITDLQKKNIDLTARVTELTDRLNSVEQTANDALHKVCNHKHTLYGRQGGGDTMGPGF